MSHIYQPAMIRELLTRGGKANIRNIAAVFLARDVSQLEYYEQITKDMPGKVLGKHGVVGRDGDEYRLTIDPSSLSSEQRDELVQLCDEAISARASRLQGMSATNKTRFHMPDGPAQRERDAEMPRGATDWSRAAIGWLFAHDAELIEVQR